MQCWVVSTVVTHNSRDSEGSMWFPTFLEGNKLSNHNLNSYTKQPHYLTLLHKLPHCDYIKFSIN